LRTWPRRSQIWFRVNDRLTGSLLAFLLFRVPVVESAPAAQSSPMVALGKQAYDTQVDLDQQKAYAYAREVMSMNSLAHDAQEGISAFLEKRTPYWIGQ